MHTSPIIIDSFHITWWLWKPVDGHLDWLHFDTFGSLNNCTCSCINNHDSFMSRGVKVQSIKVAILLHLFPWSPRYEKLVYGEPFYCWQAGQLYCFFFRGVCMCFFHTKGGSWQLNAWSVISEACRQNTAWLDFLLLHFCNSFTSLISFLPSSQQRVSHDYSGGGQSRKERDVKVPLVDRRRCSCGVVCWTHLPGVYAQEST